MLSDPCYPVGVLAKLFNISERRVQQLAASNVIPKPNKGQYPLLGTLRGYLAFLQQRSERDSLGPEGSAIKRQRLRLLKAQADRMEQENAAWRQDWVEIQVVQQAFEALGATFIACVDALPGRLAFELAGFQDPSVIKSKLFAACRELRNTTGEQLHALAAHLAMRDETGDANPSAPAPDTGSVGGQLPELATGQCGTGALAQSPHPLYDSHCAELHQPSLPASDCSDGQSNGKNRRPL